MHGDKIEVLGQYTVLRPLSQHSKTYLCKEDATHRLLVIKRFQNERVEFFAKEAQALNELASSGICPQLYFATRLKDEAIIGMQYKTGKPLLELAKKSDFDTMLSIKNKLIKTIKDLHTNFHYAHCDLNPNNILVKMDKSATNMCILDWEFSEKIRNENINNYSKFRGTLGITPKIQENSLVNRDLLSINNIFHQFFPMETKTNTKSSLLGRFKKWM